MCQNEKHHKDELSLWIEAWKYTCFLRRRHRRRGNKISSTVSASRCSCRKVNKDYFMCSGTSCWCMCCWHRWGKCRWVCLYDDTAVQNILHECIVYYTAYLRSVLYTTRHMDDSARQHTLCVYCVLHNMHTVYDDTIQHSTSIMTIQHNPLLLLK